ncbi:MAG: glycosyltransferase involved in cell wall biosynthesis [Desulforhopalus sp.]|jgi:glycosyltransferase involved in cell wall biosynthesis
MNQHIPTAETKTLAYILKGYPRISETFISNEILLLEKLGFKMHLFPMRKPRESFSHASVKEIKATVSYLPTELFKNFSKLLIPNILLAARHPRRFIKTLRLAAGGNAQNKLATLKHFLQAGYMSYYHLTGESKIGHLHGHFAHSPTSVTRFAASFSGLPYSFTAHAKDIYTSKREKLRQRIEEAEFVITCTKHNQEYLEELRGDCPTPIHCIYHGIDLSLFQNDARQVTTENHHRIFTVARLTTKKGLPTIYQALHLLKQKGITFTHTLIGDGDDRDAITALIKTLGLEEQCVCLGTRTHEEVLKQFKKSDLFVLGCEIAPNGDRDGIPNVLVESLAMGIPALSTNISAIPEILINEKTGLTITPKDPEAMAMAMERILTDTVLRETLIESGKELVATKFDNKLLIGELAAIFRSTVPALV